MNNFLPSTPNFLSSSSSCPLSVTKQGLCWLGNQNIKLVSTVSILRISRLWVSTGEGSGTPSSVLAWRIPGTGAWWASIYGVAQSWTRLMQLSSSSSSSRVSTRMVLLWIKLCVPRGLDFLESKYKPKLKPKWAWVWISGLSTSLSQQFFAFTLKTCLVYLSYDRHCIGMGVQRWMQQQGQCFHWVGKSTVKHKHKASNCNKH